MKYLLLIMSFTLSFVLYAQKNPYEDLCIKGDELYNKGRYAEALEQYKQCFPECKECNNKVREANYEDCIKRLKKPEYLVHQSGKPLKLPQYEIPRKFEIPFVESDTAIIEPNEATEQPVELREIIYIKIDTLFITDNSNLIHPYSFIKSWTMEKKTWRWVFNSVGVAAVVGGGIGFGISAQVNYKNHENNIAPTKSKHERYYSNYKVYNGLMWGCIGLGAVLLSSNFLKSPVKDKITISPGIYVDPQGNVVTSVNIKF